MEDDKVKGPSPRPEAPLVSHQRYVSQVKQICSQHLPSGVYRPFKVIQGNTITLAHPDLPSGVYRPFKVIQGNTITLAHPDEPYINNMESHGILVPRTRT